MNPNNPLLNRLYQTKSSKKKRPTSIKDELSNRDKVLVPKLAAKNPMQLTANLGAQKQKTVLLKQNITKLPPLSEKQLGKQKQQIIRSQKKTTFRQRKVSFNTTHDLLMFPTELSFNTPKLEQRYEDQVSQMDKKQSVKKFKTVASETYNQKNEQQVFQYLKILEKNEQLKEQFCYMNRGRLPYSYEIVDYQNINKNEFLTVSLRGISIYKDGQSQFTTAENLSREIELYRKVKKIDYFSTYILVKTLNHWRYRSVRRKFQGQCRFISRNLLSQNLIIQKYLQFLVNLKQDFSKCKFIDIRISSTGNLQALQGQLKQKQATIQKSLQYFENTVQKYLKQAIQKNLIRFRKQQRVSLNTDGKQVGQETFLPYDTKKKSMKYTQIAKLKQFQQSMYKLLKMTDFIRFTTKCIMIKDGLEDFCAEMKILRQKFIKRRQASFVSWISMSIKIEKPNKNQDSRFNCFPTVQEIRIILQRHLQNVIDKFYKKHYLLIDKKDEYFCQSYEPVTQQFPNKLDFKYYIEGTKQFSDLKSQCIQRLNTCLNDTVQHLEKADKTLLKIYDDSFINHDINYYMENETLKNYLTTHLQCRQIINKWEQIVQFGIIYLDMSEALMAVRDKFQQKFKYISNAIPVQVVRRCELLAQKIKNIYNIFKQNPSTVMEFIKFMKSYNEYKKQIQEMDKKIEGILQLQQMVYKNGLRIGESSKIHITQCTTYFRELSKRFQQIQGNQQKQRKKFYKIIDDMVDPLDKKSEELYEKIYQDELITNSFSPTTKCLQKLQEFQQQFEKLKEKKEELFYYQNQLKLGHKDLPNFFKLQSNLEWIVKIWKGRKKYEQFLNHVNTRGYAQKTDLNIADMKQFLKDIQIATSQIQLVELLQNFKHDALDVMNIFQICKLLSSQTLQDEHKNQIKQKMITKNKKIKDYLFLIEGGRSIICRELVRDTNIVQIKHQLQEVVHSSAQQSIIKKNIQEIQQFWKKNKIYIVHQDIAKNGTQIPHFDRHQNQNLLQKVGSYLMSFKSIFGSKHSVGELKSRVAQQIQTCQYLKKFIQKWIQVEGQWMKLLPLMTNCPSVKHQSNVYFQFTSLDNSIKKHNRQINDLQSLKKIVEDYSQKRYLSLIQGIEDDLKQVNKIFASFLEMKRNTYHRFFFLADQELINILQNTKDAKTLANYAGYCFNCDRLLLDKQLVSGFQTPMQTFKLRKNTLKGQPDQMFKSVEENMRVSLKYSILSLLPKMKIGMNIEQQHQNSLQCVLLADKFLWTEMTQTYLNQTSYESYQFFLRRSCQELIKFIKRPDLSPQYRHKVSARLIQAMGLRQTGEEMIKLQITKDDFKWKQQRKYTVQEEQIIITQFNNKFLYGLEYYPPSKITIPTENYKMLLSRAFETSIMGKVLIINGVEGDGKRNLMLSCAQEYGCYYKEIVCNKNISMQYILRFVQGAIYAGAWLSFYEFQHLQNKVLVRLLNQIKKVITKIKQIQQGEQMQNSLTVSGNIQNVPNALPNMQNSNAKNMWLGNNISSPLTQTEKTVFRTNNRVMFSLITHGFYPEKVSVYQFDNFSLSEPHHQKICQWLLQVNNFADWQELSLRLVTFIETIFPFLERVMGSFMRILRKIIDTACIKKKQYAYNYKETDILAQTFKEQILDKSDGNIHHILYQAMHTYFNYQIPGEYSINSQQKKLKGRSPRKQSFCIDTKLTVLCSLIKKKIPRILVIGPRTNKSALIRQAGLKLNRQIFSIYPQATDYFFNEQTIEKLNNLDPFQIVHYDGEQIVREWNDLVISDYLLMEGKKINLHNQLIIELRAVQNCSPSFVGSCQIVYVGNSLSKKQKFTLLSQAGSCQLIMQPMVHIFGQQLQNLPNHLVETFAKFFKPFALEPRSKNYHKLIAWLGTILGIQGLWNRFYGGRHTDVTLNKFSQQLSPIDESKYIPFEQKIFSDNFTRNTLTIGNMLIQTKSTILYFELIKNLLQNSMPVLLTGKYNSGKSTFVKLLLNNIKNLTNINKKFTKNQNIKQSEGKQAQQSDEKDQILNSEVSEVSRISLPIKMKTKDWAKYLKTQLTNIRREGKSYLVNIGNNDIIVAVDDLDLGFETHRQFIRQLIDMKSMHDYRFDEYFIEKAKIIGVWHKQNAQQIVNSSKASQDGGTFKLFDRMTQLSISEFSKESLTTIIRANIEHFTKKNNMSKEVINVIDSHLVKCLLIAFDDIANISGQNSSASIVLSVLRNLLSLPKKNVLMSSQNYVNYFKIQLKTRVMEKCFTKKSSWQYNNVLQNLDKVIFNNLFPKTQTHHNQSPSKNELEEGQKGEELVDETILIFQQNQFKNMQMSKLKQRINSAFPNLYIFDQMLKVIIKLSNQLHLIDHNCIMIGRTGTGKETILKVVAFLNKITICQDKNNLSQCIVRCLRGENVILMESYLRREFAKLIFNNTGTVFQKIQKCITDDDLEKLIIQEQYKKQYLTLVAQIPNREGFESSKKALNRVLNRLKSVLIFDTLNKYKQAYSRYRELNRYFVCYIDEWPAQALLNISGVNIPKNQSSPVKQVLKNQSQPQAGEKIAKISQAEISKILAQVFACTNRIMQDFQQSSISIKKFKFYLRIFEIMYKIRNEQLIGKVQFYTKVYSKFNDACNLISQWERRVDILKVELEESLRNLDEQLKKNKTESTTFALLYDQMNRQQEILNQKNQEMSELKRLMEKQLQGMKKMMENISKIVGSMQRTEMSQLKKIYKSNKIVSFGLQCLCILLGEEPIEKSINKILADPNLMMKMKSQQVLDHKNERIMQKFKMQYNTIKQQYDNKSKQQASRVLIDWLRSILEYWVVLENHQELNVNYKKHKKQLEQSLKKQKQIQGKINQLKEQMISLNRNFDELFQKKEENQSEYNKISLKIKNAKKLLPALKKSEEQTWEIIKQIRMNLSCLVGNIILSTACLVYLPLKRLRLKKGVLDQIKKLLNSRMIQFSNDFMSLITKTQDAVIQDLNLVALKQLQEYPVLIIDPERRAIPFLYDHQPNIAATVISKNLSELANSQDILAEIEKYVKEASQKYKRVQDYKQKKNEDSNQNQQMDQSQIIDEGMMQSQILKYNRKNPILHTTDENYKPLLEKLPENTIIIDWKFTTINTNQKIFLRIASNKKPEYFQAKKQLNKKIKKDLQKIQEYKREIYETICSKQIKILDDMQFVEMGIKLESLEVETQKNRVLEKQKIQQIKQYATEINQQVSKVIYMINALKKIKNVALDIILDVACTDSNTLENIIKWVLATIEPNKRLGWLLSIVFDYQGEVNQQLFSILIKDTPLKISQISRHKKPINISNKNFQNLCKISGYSTNLKAFSQISLKNAKQFEAWTLESVGNDEIPPIFKPQLLNTLQQLVVIKIFKPKIMLSGIKKHIKSTLKIKQLTGYSNKQLLIRTSKRIPIITHCSMEQLQKLCAELNNSKICVKNLIQIYDSLELKRFLWAQMAEGNWVVLHSIYDRNAKEFLQDIVQYVSNYQEQESFRVFIYVDQIELGGYENIQQITTKYNNISSQISKNNKKQNTEEAKLLSESKYIENIGINMYEQSPSFSVQFKQMFEMLKIQIPEVSIETAQTNPAAASFIVPQTPANLKSSIQKPNTPLNVGSALMPLILNASILGSAQKQRIYNEKLAVFMVIWHIAAWLKFPKIRMAKNKGKLIKLLQYIRQYNVPLEFNLYAVASYLGKLYSSPLDSSDRVDAQQLAERILDESKINDRQLYGIPIHKQSIALALAGIGRAGIEVDKNWINQRLRNNYQLLGCQQSYIAHKNAQQVEKILNILGQIKFFNKSVKQQVAQIRLALARLPTNVLVFSRQVKNIIFLHCYMKQLEYHNKKIVGAKEFLQWVNISSNQDFKQQDVVTYKINGQAVTKNISNATDTFTWDNLLQKIKRLTDLQVSRLKVRSVLSNWLNNLKRKHQFLLYWNLDNPILTIHPILVTNFSMILSTYIINYLSTNYSKIRMQSQSTNQAVLYTLQIQFSRQTDQKQLYMTEGVLLPDLIYKQFKYNFEFKMLDGIIQWNGEEPAPLIMLKMKKLYNVYDGTGKEKDEDYESPSIEIATRFNNKIEVVYKLHTFIDGNFQQWPFRRPMLISQ